MINQVTSKRKVISIVSAKGGAGKSLLTAVVGCALARQDMQVLIVDCDIIVPEFKILFDQYCNNLEPRQKTLTFSDFLKPNIDKYLNESPVTIEELSGLQFNSSPAVLRAEEIFQDFKLIMTSLKSCKSTMAKLLQKIPDNFDLILLDNRAGIDFLVLASCDVSDIVLTVTEDDPVSIDINSNLIAFLENNKEIKIPQIYTILNKVRRFYSDLDLGLETNRVQKSNYHCLGFIPFDSEVMDDFDTNSFWSSVYQTLYFREVIKIWNSLANKNKFELLKINKGKYIFPPEILMLQYTGILPLLDRILVFLGIAVILLSTVYFVFYLLQIDNININILLALILPFLGIMLIIAGITGFRQKTIGTNVLSTPSQYQ